MALLAGFGLDLPASLYPTVGLQTPGEVIDANFGQEPFLFDIEGEMRALRRKTRYDYCYTNFSVQID